MGFYILVITAQHPTHSRYYRINETNTFILTKCNHSIPLAWMSWEIHQLGLENQTPYFTGRLYIRVPYFVSTLAGITY